MAGWIGKMELNIKANGEMEYKMGMVNYYITTKLLNLEFLLITIIFNRMIIKFLLNYKNI